MDYLYRENELCLNFTNDELSRYIVQPLKKFKDLDIRLYSDDEAVLSSNKDRKITHIILDGNEENFYIAFYDDMTAVFILNEEFMFINDNAKKNYTSSETYKNVVYEGNLRNKSHIKILKILYDFVVILKDSKQMTIKETKVTQEGFEYPKCDYNIKLIKPDSSQICEKQFANITFCIDD